VNVGPPSWVVARKVPSGNTQREHRMPGIHYRQHVSMALRRACLRAGRCPAMPASCDRSGQDPAQYAKACGRTSLIGYASVGRPSTGTRAIPSTHPLSPMQSLHGRMLERMGVNSRRHHPHRPNVAAVNVTATCPPSAPRGPGWNLSRSPHSPATQEFCPVGTPAPFHPACSAPEARLFCSPGPR